VTVPVAASADLATPEAIAKSSGSSFLVSFAFLSRERRRGITAVYAFCRVVDDAVDDAPDATEGRARLGGWREELRRAYEDTPQTEVGRGLQDAARRFGVPRQALEDVVDGVAMDLEPRTYANADELEHYCYRVASAVGLACLPVFGAHGREAEHYAELLGRALQWTNILRDLREDALQGRVYAPQDWLAAEGLGIDELAGRGDPSVYAPHGPASRVSARFVERAQDYFDAARACRPAELRRELLPARIMGAVYRDVLQKLERRGGAWTEPRVRSSRRRKLWIAMRTWLGRR